MGVEVRDNAADGRFEILLDGTVAGIAAYTVREDALVFTHTEVDPGHEGQGLGSKLAAGALDAARERGATVVPRCPFIKAYIERHPAYQDLLAA
ncbi:GNAT family N-acetyltransferase [Catenuloplanes atrovinosus]|uniref:GNAT family acetyltransferase n=1 Tax=Catenuloplanes atrovinosus TaxID=137266 RepID=A0AAE4C9Y1_9ACTN|nr:GNAT family N-acetyltransferase [Catenuloplanes atrovinosus]MDR7274065.1 putative GNAT family acetyltransferase [Catenuloplanes atrovinosus]